MGTAPERLRAAIARMHEPWGGVLCLDFANTLEPRGGSPPISTPPDFSFRDELLAYTDLIAWTIRKEALPCETGVASLATADRHPEQASAVVGRAHVLRDAIYRVFWHIAQQQASPAADLSTMAREHADGALAASLVASDEGVRWDWPDDGVNLARPLWPVAWSATELATTGDSARINVCPGSPGQPVPSAWLFYDETKEPQSSLVQHG